VDVFLGIASKRDGRDYAPEPIPDELAARILDAGRLTGSASNRQPWTFVVVDSAPARAEAAASVYRPRLVETAALVVAIVVRRQGGMFDFDAGRLAQNMMLAAWELGIVSCPNGIADRDRLDRLLGATESDRVVVVVTFGYPPRRRDPSRRPAESWSATANRRSPEDVTRRI
jgi:nitroreductase